MAWTAMSTGCHITTRAPKRNKFKVHQSILAEQSRDIVRGGDATAAGIALGPNWGTAAIRQPYGLWAAYQITSIAAGAVGRVGRILGSTREMPCALLPSSWRIVAHAIQAT
jgi:hypothetical protein